jgi:peptidoglycan/LPS O-acetylase OafA/YrhL
VPAEPAATAQVSWPPAADRRAERAQRLPGLDGLRAIGVAAVVLFHLDPQLLPGGFLGVDLFFVVSGFLITRLLLTEIAQHGRLRVGRFYGRRVRRLFPAVAVLLVAVSLAGTLVWRDELATLRGSVGSSLSYVTNWWLIGAHQSYFVSTGRPPMLQHLWSLAIEEQYYLLWPAIILLVSGVARRRDAGQPARFGRVVVVALLLALASTLAMAVIAVATQVPYVSDSSRVYFGTDTHSMGLFLGSALGAYSVLHVPPGQARHHYRPALRWLGDALAAACLAGLIWRFTTQSEYSPDLYRVGFLLFDAAAAVVIWVVIGHRSKLGWLLERPIVRGIGRRSYSIYLWHWPVAVVTRPGIDVNGSKLVINLARIGLILLLAEGSYRLVERPMRAGQWHVPRTRTVPRTVEDLRLVIGAITGMTCLAVLIGAQSGSASSVPSAGPPAYVPPTSRASVTPGPRAPTQAAARSTEAPATLPASKPAPAVTRAVPTTRPPAVLPPPAPTSPAISAFGDSVLLGARGALTSRDPAVTVDAAEGRQPRVVLRAIVAAYRGGRLAPIVEIHIGNNGVIRPSQLSSTLALLKDRRQVILLTDHVPRDWQGINNQTLTSVGARFANVTVIDWNAIANANRPWFYNDGLHLNGSGSAGYAQLILSTARR